MLPTLTVVIILLFVLVLVYFWLYRPWQLHWGATEDEIAAALPGDEIVLKPSFNATRAVTIHAPPTGIFPWIVQIGINRAGWYSYDLLDNLGHKSAETLLPQFQVPQPGDLVPMSPDGRQGIWVKAFERDRWMLWWDRTGDTSWVWVIVPQDGLSCRLITRVRMKYSWLSWAAPFNVLVEFFDLPMMRKCLYGIKRRAEALTTASWPKN